MRIKKKIIVVQRNYAIGINSGDKSRTLNMANSLSNLGYDVYLVGFFTKGILSYRKEKKQLSKGIHAFLIFSLPSSFHLHKLAGWYQAVIMWLLVKWFHIDAIQAELSHAAICTRFLPHIPLITDFHSDLVPEFEMANMPFYKIKQAADDNQWALTHSKATITVSRGLYENLGEYGGLSKNYILPCSFDTELFSSVISNEELRHKMRNSLNIAADKIVLCYSGGLHIWQCIDETLDWVIRLKQLNQNYFLCLFTNDDISKYQRKLEQLGSDYLVKGLSRSEMPAYLSVIDAGFVLRKNSKVNTNASPTKTAEYLAVGAMVIATPFAGDAPELISDSGCGVILDSLSPTDESLQKLDEQIVKYVRHYSENSKRAKDYIYAHRAWLQNELQLKSLYEDVFNCDKDKS